VGSPWTLHVAPATHGCANFEDKTRLLCTSSPLSQLAQLLSSFIKAVQLIVFLFHPPLGDLPKSSSWLCRLPSGQPPVNNMSGSATPFSHFSPRPSFLRLSSPHFYTGRGNHYSPLARPIFSPYGSGNPLRSGCIPMSHS